MTAEYQETQNHQFLPSFIIDPLASVSDPEDWVSIPLLSLSAFNFSKRSKKRSRMEDLIRLVAKKYVPKSGWNMGHGLWSLGMYKANYHIVTELSKKIKIFP